MRRMGGPRRGTTRGPRWGGALALLTLVACRSVEAPTPNHRLVVLVVVDTLRDDYLSPASTPRILAALHGARRFTDTRANSSWTLPSLASALTSRPVLELTAADGTLIGIPPAETTLAERLHDAGFVTAAFVANATLREGNGFAQGFDRFETTGAVSDPPPDATAILAAAGAWLKERSGLPGDAFVWVHLMEPHEPLLDHRSPQGRGRVAVEARVLAGRERAPTAAEADTFRELYAGEVSYLDRQLGEFLEGLPDDAIVALISDHGEMLGEGTAWGHGMTLYEPVLRVPFLLRAPDLPGKRTDKSADTSSDKLDDQPAELLDLVPTLLGRLGIEAPVGSLAGIDLLADRLTTPQLVESAGRTRLAVTFSAGPLRWSLRRGTLAVLAHFAPQTTISSSPVTLLERDPLPTGIWTYDPIADPVAARGQSLETAPPALTAEVAQAFAADVGRLSPGIHALLVGQPKGSAWEFEGDPLPPGAPIEVARIDATSTIQFDRVGHRVRFRSDAPQSLAMIAFGRQAAATPVGEGWTVSRRGVPQAFSSPGLFLWRNPREPPAQHPQAEILERLKALGYLR